MLHPEEILAEHFAYLLSGSSAPLRFSEELLALAQQLRLISATAQQ
ncbi:MAG: hypothetical protein HC821_00725 [Lewinella sp.]|nr:hypothetical protein [Lewinella sp.]